MKRKICLLLAFLLIIFSPISSFAYRKDKHDDFLEQVLFGQNGYKGTDFEAKKAIIILNAACAVTIDQYNGSYSEELNDLKAYGVRRLPSSINAINFTGGPDHRKRTHLGWDHDYPETKVNNANWPVRKTILLSTVNKVFDFGFFSGWFGNYNDKCKSFSAIIYYVHILGDTIADEKEKSNHDQKVIDRTLLPLVVRQQSDVAPDIISELQKHINVLFADQDHSTLDKKLEQLRRQLYSVGYISNSEYSTTYYGYAQKCMDTLIEEIPDLLKQESFFTKVFPIS